MMMRHIARGLFLSAALAYCIGCDLPGRPRGGPEVPRPDEVKGFDQLYAQNCAGCHGANGEQGAATDLANPEYEAWIDDASLRSAIAQGEPGSLMPAFALAHGGTLTEAQIDVLARGLRSRWGKAGAFGGASPPPYRASGPGVEGDGAAVYQSACARCHGATAQQPGTAGSILDPSFLALVNAQSLRTAIVAGRPDIGQPDWRNDIPGRALTDAEVTNVTAWLLRQSPTFSANKSAGASSAGGHP